MTDCPHPYESVKEIKVDAMVEERNLPINRTSADICEACKSVIGTEGSSGFVMELLANTGCDHPHDSIEDGTVIIVPVGQEDIVLGRVRTQICDDCGHPVDLDRIEL